MIEDESGRIQLIGDRLKKANLVTGVIVGALGMETNDGGFEVADLCYAGMPPQESDPDVSPPSKGEDKMDVDGTITHPPIEQTGIDTCYRWWGPTRVGGIYIWTFARRR